MKYREYKQLNLPAIGKEVLNFWKQENIFQKSIDSRPAGKPFNFYEGPPSANGMPGIHHVMARAIKDIFCRYKTLQGYQVKRKGGWDTHGLPIELAVEKALGITKEDIGKKISVEEYNAACRKEVMKYTDVWNDLTEKMGYWVDLDNPYVTYENEYIESLWWLLKQLYNKGLLYKGYTIQPYSPAAGTGLSSHELNQPGTYKPVKDITAVAMFEIVDSQKSKVLSLFDSGLQNPDSRLSFLAWTTTPWTLPSNTALAVGKNITYVAVKTFNPYTHELTTVIMAKELMGKYFPEANAAIPFDAYKAGDKAIPFSVLGECKGKDLAGIRYEQLLSYTQPEEGDAFKVLIGDFVTTEDGTGIVHIAPSFGADDFKVGKQNGMGSLTLVDKRGRFVEEVSDFANEFVKEDYLSDAEKATEVERLKTLPQTNELNKLIAQIVGRTNAYLSVDERITLKLQFEGKLFKKEKYEHSYPHCWRTDKPILYYPLDSWFIKTTAYKDKMVALNKTINWKPESTGTGRFGNWLENLVDWNLSRSRYWGTPLPIWRTEDGTEEKCIGSIEELTTEVEKATKAGIDSKFKIQNSKLDIELHRPYVDDVVLISDSGKKMYRELDLIDVWFDSGAMPYAQHHLKPNSLANLQGLFPADFIAEGVDQTRGWFFTLHAIASMLFEEVAFKNVVSNGLVLDKNGNKMSKRLGNAVDPFTTIDTYSADAARWYMISNAAPWENLKFNIEGLGEVQRKFFGTLYNTYSFFALYANIDGFVINAQPQIPVAQRPELDRWILSALQNLIIDVEDCYETYEPHRAARAIQEFVDEHLSNWYVRLARRRFWRGEMTEDKQAAYETLYECLNVTAQLMSPVAPFFADWLFKNLNNKEESVHLSYWPKSHASIIDETLNESMQLAQDISSMILSLRKKVDIRVRQPLQKVLLPVLDPQFKTKVEHVKDLILSETNIKEIEYIDDASGILIKNIKANFKILGKKAGALMKELGAAIAEMTQEQIAELEANGAFELQLATGNWQLATEDVEIGSQDIPGWQVTSMGKLTVALDITLTEALKQEGIAREVINRVQNLRKEKDFEVTDKINVSLEEHPTLQEAIGNNLTYICAEILAANFNTNITAGSTDEIEIEGINLKINISKA